MILIWDLYSSSTILESTICVIDEFWFKELEAWTKDSFPRFINYFNLKSYHFYYFQSKHKSAQKYAIFSDLIQI